MMSAQGWHEVGMRSAQGWHKVGMRLSRGLQEVCLRFDLIPKQNLIGYFTITPFQMPNFNQSLFSKIDLLFIKVPRSPLPRFPKSLRHPNSNNKTCQDILSAKCKQSCMFHVKIS